MKFGINFFPAFRESDISTSDFYDQSLRLAERADALGYNTIKTVEHSFYDYGGRSPNPVVFLSAVAQRTKRIRLITGAVIPSFHHPVHLGAELAMLDQLSHGRLEAGFGRAFLPKEFEVYGISMEESRARMEESIGVIRRLWTEDRVTHEGRFWKFNDVHLMPRTYQKPHPPVWIAAISSEESFVYAAKNGFNVMIVPYAGKPGVLQELMKTYRRVWRESGHPPGAEKVQVSIFTCVAETNDEARRTFRRIMGRYIETFAEAASTWRDTTSPNYVGYEKMVQGIVSTSPDDVIEKGGAFVGSPAEVIAQVKASVERFGEIEPSMHINMGGPTEAEAMRTLELFGTQVMPAFPD
ncbi:MAG: LLM class flavin-dependent oxidoreductase [Burkholderiales bacterium]